MRRIGRTTRAGALVACAAAFAVGAPHDASPQVAFDIEPDVVLLGGRLFDATGDVLRPNPGIAIRAGVILQIGLPDEIADAPGTEVVRLDPDQTILPGLFDLHAHYAVDLFGEGRVDEYEVNPLLFLANGVTSTFPSGEVDPEGMLRARRAIDAGERPGPRIYNSGPYFGSARPGWSHEAVTPDSVRAEVDVWAARGARGFKAKGIRRAQLEALIDQAHRHGLPVNAHLDSGRRGSVNPTDAIVMGIDRVEHFLGGPVTPPERSAYASLEVFDVADPESRGLLDAVVALYVHRGVFFDATLSAYGYFAPAADPPVYEHWTDEAAVLTPYARSVVEARTPRDPIETFGRIYEVKRRTLRAFVEGGGADLLTLGTDHPSWGEYFAGFGAHRELHAWVRAGVPEAVALRAATINGARAIGMSDRLGTLEVGKYADLFVVRGDPLEDIRATRSVELVVKSGRLYDPRELLDAARGRLGPADEREASWWKGSERFR